ncbi:type I-C CRISPR-associated protein Cas5c [Chakrabartyella piscis]|uniref:type I-C CRISPR-associated protein Cas5c n=1 Tax=Chakrabartyella piscis TaxID=2918914 RepID=UPI00295887D9|nr:type I-C CRISPR-associated protein Cas5c [Chakrabartyella piscis]
MGFKIIVEGDYACFTRPELKVERVSYDVPTPGALEGLLKSIYWKPAIRYVVDEIVVYHPINFMNIRRNEVKNKVSMQHMRGQMNGMRKDPSIYTSECRSQRASMILKDVKYGIAFHFEMTGNQSDHADESAEKHYNIIKRRLEKGQAFRTPCLGCSEYAARKITLVEDFDLEEIAEEIRGMGDIDLGFMSYKVDFQDKGQPVNGDWENPKFSDQASTLYYRPHMVNGIIDVKKYRQDLRG